MSLFAGIATANDGSVAAVDALAAPAAIRHARQLWDSNEPQQREQAIALLRRAAQQGAAGAQSFLGWAHLEGQTVPRDAAAARSWLEAAAAQGDAYAMLLLASIYERGDGVARDESRARQLALRAADLHDPDAQVYAASLLLSGTAQPADKQRAQLYLAAGIRAGDARAMVAMGVELYRGTVLARDFGQSCTLLQQASDKDLVLARLWLAQCYARGRGVPADAARAEELFAQALRAVPISAVNDFSWELSVSRDEQLRDGVRAVALMRAALVDRKEPRHHYLDTLAAAYAEAGDFPQAVQTQLAAIEAAKRSAASLRAPADLLERLALYRSGVPFRE